MAAGVPPIRRVEAASYASGRERPGMPDDGSGNQRDERGESGRTRTPVVPTLGNAVTPARARGHRKVMGTSGACAESRVGSGYPACPFPVPE